MGNFLKKGIVERLKKERNVCMVRAGEHLLSFTFLRVTGAFISLGRILIFFLEFFSPPKNGIYISNKGRVELCGRNALSVIGWPFLSTISFG